MKTDVDSPGNEPRASIRVAKLTADVPAAIGTIRICGGAAIPLVQRFVHASSRRNVEEQWTIDQLYFGLWRSSHLVDGEHVVVCRTDEQALELHCHGGPAISRRILQDLADSGCELVGPWEHASCEAERSPLRLAAERELVRATAPQAALLLLDQVNGALDQSLELMVDDLRGKRFQLAKQRISRLLALSPLGLRLARPWRLVLAGPPNTGKSSLINALSGQQHAIVHHEPGTTRDWLEVETLIDGWPVSLTDTAGIRSIAHDPIEVEGITRSRQQIAEADLVLLVVDAAVGWSETHAELASELSRLEKRGVVVLNKIDMARSLSRDSLVASLTDCPLPAEIVTSSCAVEGGVLGLLDHLGQRLVEHQPIAGEGIPFTEEQVLALKRIEQALLGRALVEAEQLLLGMLRQATCG